MKGNCAYGAKCRYDHVKPRTTSAKPPQLSATPRRPEPAPVSTEPVTVRDSTSGPAYSSIASVPAAAEGLIEDEEDDPLCPFGLASTACPYLDECEYRHGDPCPCCLKLCLDPRAPDTHEAHINACVQQMESNLRDKAAKDASRGIDCSICLEEVLGKETQGQQRCGRFNFYVIVLMQIDLEF